MLKNTKFLYAVIAFFLVVCVLCGIHIAKERSLMYEKRTHYVQTFSAQTEGVLEWIRSALESDDANDISNSLAAAQNHLDSLIDIAYVGTYYSFHYNTLLTEKTFFGSAGMFYYDLMVIDERFGEIQNRLSENKTLSEEDIEYLEYAEEAFTYLFERIETNGIINENAIKSDTYLSSACGYFCYMMLNK
ncbi:MAG: hypothetical protein IKJ82_07315 [Oscillospiraceae bacterium]|nr:hypothetical protein [Oscillospiraceae bacterium]